MKKLIAVLLCMMMLVPTLGVLSGCGKNEDVKAEDGTVTRVTVDINPSVELMVDDENKVVSVTALNDDGSVLIAGEVLVGKTYDEAVEQIVSLATDTGYIVKASANADDNTVKISVSGDTDYAEAVKKKAEEAVNSFFEDHDIKGKVEEAKAMNLTELRALAVETGLCTEEEAAEMDEKALYTLLAASRIETAQLLTDELREAYYRAKDYEISFAEKEETAKIISSMGILYSALTTAYSSALELYSNAINAIDEYRYNALVSPESDYQKLLTNLRENKTEYLKEKNYVASLDVNGEEYAKASVTLQASEEDYDNAVAALEELGTQINAAIEELVAKLRTVEDSLKEIEDSFLSTDEVKEKLTASAAELESAVNEKKDQFFADFEAAHKDDIDSIESSLEAQKQALIKAAKGETETEAQ